MKIVKIVRKSDASKEEPWYAHSGMAKLNEALKVAEDEKKYLNNKLAYLSSGKAAKEGVSEQSITEQKISFTTYVSYIEQIIQSLKETRKKAKAYFG